mmetsp:Transcript_91220/g.244269  ORF Transcript_91220/g.244269 Transcript_91220/m.244269 type:complete len:275 (+) Transcript_91220:835-1659(+)
MSSCRLERPAPGAARWASRPSVDAATLASPPLRLRWEQRVSRTRGLLQVSTTLRWNTEVCGAPSASFNTWTIVDAISRRSHASPTNAPCSFCTPPSAANSSTLSSLRSSNSRHSATCCTTSGSLRKFASCSAAASTGMLFGTWTAPLPRKRSRTGLTFMGLLAWRATPKARTASTTSSAVSEPWNLWNPVPPAFLRRRTRHTQQQTQVRSSRTAPPAAAAAISGSSRAKSRALSNRVSIHVGESLLRAPTVAVVVVSDAAVVVVVVNGCSITLS